MSKTIRMSIVCAAMVSILAIGASAVRADEIASATATDGSGVKIEITSLKRTEGDTVTLKFQIRNDGNRDFSVIVGNSRLVDLAQRKIFDTGLYSSSCAAAAGGKTSCYAVYAAPAPATKSLTLKLYEPQFDLVTGIPLSE